MPIPFPVCVTSGTVGVVERCGKFDRLAAPGMHCMFCCIDSMAQRVSTRVQQLEVATDTKTKDDVTVMVKVAVQYRVLNEYLSPESQSMLRDGEVAVSVGATSSDKRNIEDHGVWRAHYKLTGVKSQFRAYVEDVVRSEIPQKTLDEVYEIKQDVAHAVQDTLAHELGQYGYKIVNVLVTDICPDKTVQNAMNEINSARRLRMAAMEKAEASKIMKVKDAEAESESKYLQGMGVSRQRKAIINGLKESVNEFQGGVDGTSAHDVMQLVMMTQYLDTIKDASGHGNSTVFIPGNPGGVNELQGQIRQGLMEASNKKA